MGNQLFQSIGERIETFTNAFVSAAAGNVAGALGGVVIAAVTLWVVVHGYLTIAGKNPEPIFDFAVKAVKLILVGAVCLNAGNYLTYAVGSVEGLQEALTSAMNSAGGVSASGDIYQTLDATLDNYDQVLAALTAKMSELSFLNAAGEILALFASAVLIGLAGAILVLVGGALAILAKISLVLVFAVGPFFVMCLMWPATAGFFDKWLGAALTGVLFIVFITVLLNLSTFIVNAMLAPVIQQATAASDVGDYLGISVQVVVGSVLFAFLLSQISGFATTLGGGASFAAGRIAQAIVGGSAKAAAGAAGVAGGAAAGAAASGGVRDRIVGAVKGGAKGGYYAAGAMEGGYARSRAMEAMGRAIDRASGKNNTIKRA